MEPGEAIDLELEEETTWKDRSEVICGNHDRIVRNASRPNIPTIPSWFEQPKHYFSQVFAKNWVKLRDENIDKTIKGLYWTWRGEDDPPHWHFNADLPPEWEFAPELYPPIVQTNFWFPPENEDDVLHERVATTFILATPARESDEFIAQRLSTPVWGRKLADKLYELEREQLEDELTALQLDIEERKAGLKRAYEEYVGKVDDYCAYQNKRRRTE